MAVVLTACKTEDVTKRAENEEKVLRAMIEYPGDGLYDPVITVIGISVDEPSEEELAAAEQRAAEEKQLWVEKVGNCFADGMFDTFYDKWYRTEVLGIAMNFGLTTTISQFGIQDDADQSSDNIEHALVTVIATDEKGGTKSFDMDWMVIFDKDDPSLIQKIEITDTEMIEAIEFVSDKIGIIMGAVFGIIVVIAIIRTLLKASKGESISVPPVGVMNDLPSSVTGINKNNDMSERVQERSTKKTE